MNPRNPLLWACVIAAGSATAHADIFTWFANSGIWEDHNMWNGPAGQYPDSILDTATISGLSSDATLTQNLAVGTLNVLNGAKVFSSGQSIFVHADTNITAPGSSVSVSNTPSLRDFDTDTLTINGGLLAMLSGLAQFDESLILSGSGGVVGAGIVEMNSTTGDIVLNDGTIWAKAGSGPSDTLRITRTDTSTSKLDWTSANARIAVWEGKTLHNELPYTGALGGLITVSSTNGSSQFISDHAFVAGDGSEIRMFGSNSQSTARVQAPAVDSFGLINVANFGVDQSVGVIDAPLVALRGQVELDTNAWLTIPADLLIFDSLTVTSSGPGSKIQLAQPNSTLNVIGGTTTVSMGVGSAFDLDGSGNKTVNIADGSTLSLDVESLDFSNGSPFDGTLNIDGTLHVETIAGPSSWENHGEINLDGGEITGRRLNNTGVIRGTGFVDAITINNGEIIADGGTLEFQSAAFDGDQTPADGILRAQTGDLVMNIQADGATQNFTGSIFVGNGSGVREVLNADNNLILQEIDGVRGSMHLDSGFVVLEDFLSYGDVTIDGQSLLRVTGTDGADRITMSTGSVTTINGTLEADGNTWFVQGAQVNGSGVIDMVSTNKDINFQNGADLGGVSLHASGGIFLTDTFESLAGVHALTMRDTASINISIFYSDFQQQTVNDKLTVADHAALDGTLVLKNFPQTDLPTGVTVTVIEAGSISGGFDTIDDSELGFNRRAFVTIDTDSVEVFVTCSADLNADGHANFFDVSEFLSQFNSLDPAADLNKDGEFNFFDISIFISSFNLGC